MPLYTLIVEDDRKFLKLLELRLRSWRRDIDITHAGTIGKAQEVLANEPNKFELVILDQHLPDGIGASLFEHDALRHAAVLAISSDAAPHLPAQAVKAGAQHFLGKRQISEPLFIPLVEAILERKKIEAELVQAQIQQSKMETIRVLLGTLRHEINNPLGAVLGATYILKTGKDLEEEQMEALRLLEQSGQRINHVLKQLCETAELEQVTKGHEQVFHIPGDPSWGKNNDE